MNHFGFPLRYLALQDARGRRLYRRDVPGMLAVTALLSAPFIAISYSNFFHKDGFIDKVGTFSSVLTGFYVAGLVAVATFPQNRAGLDKVIEVGPVLRPAEQPDGEPERLTRREYVCSMFGYLAFMSMIVTIASITCVTTADWLKSVKDLHLEGFGRTLMVPRGFMRAIPIALTNLVLASLFVTTVRALYYLIDRLYATSPTLLPRDDEPEPPEE